MFCISDDNFIIYTGTQQLNRNLNELLFFPIVMSKLSRFIFIYYHFFSTKILNNICTDNQILLFLFISLFFLSVLFKTKTLFWRSLYSGEKNICTFVLTVTFVVLFYLFAVKFVNKLDNDLLLLYYIIICDALRKYNKIILYYLFVFVSSSDPGRLLDVTNSQIFCAFSRPTESLIE